jgi:DNA-binding MarR family transcriptional regulator
MPLSQDPVAQARQHWIDHGWGAAADGMAAVTSLMRAQQIVLARVEGVLKGFEISFARYEVLMLLFFSKYGSLPMRVIGQRLQVHPTSVTNAVDRLESVGLVARRPHPTDRRATLIELTSAGRDVAVGATAALNSEVFTDVGLARPAVLVEEIEALRARAGDF